MPLELPNLDDRDFAQLMDGALQRIKTDLNADWSDLSPGDPGVVLLEAFAYLTEQMIYRLNRLPAKAYVAFLRTLGVTLQPPTAARVELTFRRNAPSDQPTLIEAGTQVTIAGAAGAPDAPVFVTEQNIELPAGEVGMEAKVLAFHCEPVGDEMLGTGTGFPGLTLTVRRPPIVAPLHNNLDLVVGVALEDGEEPPGDAIYTGRDGKRFLIWRETPNFANLDPNSRVYMVDRLTGVLQFAPAARLLAATGDNNQAVDHVTLTPQYSSLAAIPPAGREIRVWYSRGGGPAGNLPAGVLQELVTLPDRATVSGVSVTNLGRAQGGLEAETLDNALVRGPLELYALGRAVTARDFEWVVLSSTRSLVARARAYTKADQWRHAKPGTVQMVLVPASTVDQPQPAPSHPAYVPLDIANNLLAGQETATQRMAKAALDEKTPLGIQNELVWARYKKVWVRANVVVRGNEQPYEVKERLERFLQGLISPFPSATNPGWPFRQALGVADIYRHLLVREPSISLISSLELVVEHAPDRAIQTVAADFFQSQTWFVGSGGRLFRSLNDGAGWEMLRDFAGTPVVEPPASGEQIYVVRPSPDRAGLVAVATHKRDANGQPRSPLYVSLDCGESWHTVYSDFDSEIEDMAWMQLTNHHILLLATNKGLFEVEIPVTQLSDPSQGEASAFPSPSLVLVDRSQRNLPLYAVTVIRGKQGNVRVAVAAQSRRGVYLSNSGDLTAVDGENNPNFVLLGLRGEDIRHLSVQYVQNRIFLWAAAMTIADEGKGCYCWQFSGVQPPRNGGWWINQRWTGGSCYALAFLGARVLAVSAWGGVLVLNFDPENPDRPIAWQTIEREELPRRRTELEAEEQKRKLFLPVLTIATNNDASDRQPATPVVMVGGETGVYRSLDRGEHYDTVARTSFVHLKDTVTLPYHWLFLSGPHEISVTTGGATPAATEGGAA